MEISKGAAAWGQVAVAALLLALGLILVVFTFLQGAGAEKDVGVPSGAMDFLKWSSGVSIALSAMSFSFFRTLDGAETKAFQGIVRAAGGRFVFAAIWFVIALAVGQGATLLAELPGASSESPLDQLVLPVVMLACAFLALSNVLGALRRLVQVVITVAGADDPNPMG